MRKKEVMAGQGPEKQSFMVEDMEKKNKDMEEGRLKKREDMAGIWLKERGITKEPYNKTS